MKRVILASMLLLCMIILCSCAFPSILAMDHGGDPGEGSTRSSYSGQRFWGSYTAEKTYSFDHRYYALQTVEQPEDHEVRMVKVTVYLSETDAPLISFYTARASDFWGICWERDSYNIWAQSADIAVPCFEYREGTWVQNPDMMTPPPYIISKNDRNYRDHPELWDTIYHSPTE